jgi:hypothetical protein
MKLGLRLPTYARPGEFSSYEVLRDYVAEAEDMGVEGFFRDRPHLNQQTSLFNELA